MKALKIIGIIVLVLIVAFLALGLFAPKNFDVQRSIVINAPEQSVWKGISTFESFNKWNPWSKRDTNQVTKLEGTDGTIGAKHSWKGNKKVGEGSMTITKIEPAKAIEYDLVFIDGDREMKNIGYMNMNQEGEGYKVTWGFKGETPFPFNAIAMIMSMDKMIGKDFEEGLASLKVLCESTPAYEVAEVDWEQKDCIAYRQVVNFADFPTFFAEHYPKMFEAVGKNGSRPGIPLAVYYDYDAVGKKADVAAAVPYEGNIVSANGYNNLSLPAAKGYTIDYFGDYEKMKPAYDAMDAKLKELGKDYPSMVIEEYISDPMVEKDTSKWHTKIYFFAP